jgi:hypothetical protein
MASFFGFPNPVNETSARIVAAGAVVMGALFVATGNGWILVPLTYGFIARVLSGPKFSPLGRLATQAITPRIKVQHRFVAGPPKRFAQGVGATFSIVASVLMLSGADTAARIVIAGLVGAAFLESAFAVCLGCIMFGWLMRAGVIPKDVCGECNNFSARSLATTSNQA